MSKSVPKIALLVPFSSKEQSRIEIWQHVYSWLTKTLDYPLYIGEHIPKKPIFYNLSLARNRAAQIANDWDVAVIHDADTVISPEQIQTGVKAALETGAVTYPYTERWELDFDGTRMLLQDETSDWQSHITQHTRNQPLGGCIIVRRDLWDLVRGFDSGFVGWGHEDGAFAIACEVLSGKGIQRVTGKSLHLEHVAAPAKHFDNPVYQANKSRITRYLNDRLQPNAIELIRKLRDESVKTDKDSGIRWPALIQQNKKMDQATALMLLVDVTNVLDKYGCTHWLSDGTLLGAIRENGFIAHDYDIDLGVWITDFNPAVIHDLIRKFSCKIHKLQGKPDDGMIITVGRAGIHLDMFFYYPSKKSDKKSNKSKSLAGSYSCLYFLEKPYNTSNKAKRYNCETPGVKPLVRRKFLGHEFWVPKNAKEHLTAIYGKEWRKPKTDWDILRDQQNLVYYGLIKDMEAEMRITLQYLKLSLKLPPKGSSGGVD